MFLAFLLDIFLLRVLFFLSFCWNGQASGSKIHWHKKTFRSYILAKVNGWRDYFMQEYIQKRVLEISNYIIESSATVRQTATVFGVSKSTVHKDVTERLPLINEFIAAQVKDILENNKAERHLRGGMATKLKYAKEHEKQKALLEQEKATVSTETQIEQK